MYCLLLQISYLQRFWTRSWTLILLSIFYFASLVSLHFASFGVLFASAFCCFALMRNKQKIPYYSLLSHTIFALISFVLLRTENGQRNLELCSRYLLQTTEKRSNYCRNPDNSLTSFPPCYSQSRRLYSFALIFLSLQTHATSFSFYNSVTVHWKKERMYILHAFTNSINTTAST